MNTKAFRAALKRAGIENFRWHDLRHTWATWQRWAGTPISELKDMGAWKSAAMVERYAHANVSHLRQFADKINLRRGRVVRLKAV